jgi:hypothetical protein
MPAAKKTDSMPGIPILLHRQKKCMWISGHFPAKCLMNIAVRIPYITQDPYGKAPS